MTWRKLLLCVCLAGPLASGCEAPASPVAPDRSPAPRGDSRREELSVSVDSERTRQRFDQEIPSAAVDQRVRCPDESLPRGSVLDTTLLVRLQDARRVRRELLPFTLRASLESRAFRALEFSPTLASDDAKSGANAAALSDDSVRLRARVAALDARRYVAKLVVDGYAAPRLFRRKDAPKSEWDAGSFAGRLVVQDLLNQRSLCQAPLRVLGDASGAPISRRMRETTREALRQQLHERTWTAARGALSSISSVFHLEPQLPDGS